MMFRYMKRTQVAWLPAHWHGQKIHFMLQYNNVFIVISRCCESTCLYTSAHKASEVHQHKWLTLPVSRFT